MLDLILSTLNLTYTGTSLARVAVEVGEVEDVRLLAQVGTVDWNETVDGEDAAILWALKHEKFQIVSALIPFNKLNLEGDPSADITLVSADGEEFQVHKYFLCHRSSVFSAMLSVPMRETREGTITLRDMDSDTVSSMIHYIYTGTLDKAWQELDILELVSRSE